MPKQTTIENFLPPKPTIDQTPNKRFRSNSGTENKENNESVGNMTKIELLSALEAVIDKKMTALATKSDIAEIEKSLAEYKKENKSLKEQLKEQKQVNREVKRRLEWIENDLRKKNLIIKGIKINKNDEVDQDVSKLLSKMVGQNNIIAPIKSRIIKTNENSESIVLVKFPTVDMVDLILSKTKSLQNSIIKMERDMIMETKIRRRKFLYIRKQIKNYNDKIEIRVRNNYMLINNDKYELNEDENIVLSSTGEDGLYILKKKYNIDLKHKSNSAANSSLCRGEINLD